MSWHSTWPVGSISVKSNRQTGEDNTSYIESTLKLNHFFNQSPAGKHKFIQLPGHNNPTPASTLAGEILLFNGGLPTGGDFNLCYNGSNTLIPGGTVQMTRAEIPVSSQNGFSWLPGGILYQWGATLQSSADPLFVPFNANFVSVYNIQVTRARPNNANPGSAYVYFVDTSSIIVSGIGKGFNIINKDGHSWIYYWTAIGK